MNLLPIIPRDFYRIGVFLSGGPDSALLYYKLLKESYNVDRTREFVVMCCPKHDGADHYAELVNNWVCVWFGLQPCPILYIGNPHQPHNLIVRNAIISVLRYDIADCVVLADNTPPPDDFPGLKPIRERADHPRIFQPYFNLTKEVLIQEFFNEGIQELLTLTHTCTEQPRGACWNCWQCHERMWAFNKLGLVDPLKLT